MDAKGKAQSRQARKQALTGASSSRWAGAITRASEDAYGLAKRNLQGERASLRARADKIASGWPSALGKQEATTGRGYSGAREAVAVRPQCRPEVPGTRWPKTVRGHPVCRAHSCSLSRNGAVRRAETPAW